MADESAPKSSIPALIKLENHPKVGVVKDMVGLPKISEQVRLIRGGLPPGIGPCRTIVVVVDDEWLGEVPLNACVYVVSAAIFAKSVKAMTLFARGVGLIDLGSGKIVTPGSPPKAFALAIRTAKARVGKGKRIKTAWRRATRGGAPKKHDELIYEQARKMWSDPSIPTTAISGAVGLSVSSLYRLFKRRVSAKHGRPPKYTDDVREKIRDLLINSDLQLEEISTRSGVPTTTIISMFGSRRRLRAELAGKG